MRALHGNGAHSSAHSDAHGMPMGCILSSKPFLCGMSVKIIETGLQQKLRNTIDLSDKKTGWRSSNTGILFNSAVPRDIMSTPAAVVRTELPKRLGGIALSCRTLAIWRLRCTRNAREASE